MSTKDATRSSPAPARGLAVATAVAAFVLLALGGLVHANGAALSVPDWPLSYGRVLLTEWPGNVRWEQLHRLAAAVTSLLAIALWLRSRRTRLRRPAGWLLALVLAQVALGGVVVLTLDPPVVAVTHVLLALAVTVVAARTAIAAGPVGRPSRPQTSPRRVGRGAWLLLALLLLQALLGAVSRHPPASQTFFIATMLAHALNGLLVVGVALTLAIGRLRRASTSAGRCSAAVLGAAALAQLVVGLWIFFIAPEPLAPEWPPPAGFPTGHALHLVLAATLLIAGLSPFGPTGERTSEPVASARV